MTSRSFVWSFRAGRLSVRSWSVRKLLMTALCAMTTHAIATDLKVAAPNAVKDSIAEIAARYEKASGHRVVFAWAGSETITKRVAEGEVFDVVLNAAPNIDRLSTEGKLVAGSRTDFARSAVGVAVRSGRPHPDVSTVDSLRNALLKAESIAISSGPSGRYLEALFTRLGIADQIKQKIKQPPSGAQIAEMLARGEAEMGFQQVPELLHASGVDYLGPLPAEIQNYTIWSAGQHTAAPQREAAREFIKMLVDTESGAAIKKTGMEPM